MRGVPVCEGSSTSILNAFLTSSQCSFSLCVWRERGSAVVVGAPYSQDSRKTHHLPPPGCDLGEDCPH